jgi:hypothetical protein
MTRLQALNEHLMQFHYVSNVLIRTQARKSYFNFYKKEMYQNLQSPNISEGSDCLVPISDNE